MILVETQYKIHNDKLLAIVEALKTWHYYLKDCKYKIVVLTNHYNLHRFMDIKSLSSRQVYLAKKLSKYHFRINYYQSKANGTANALLQYFWQNTEEKTTLQVKNTKILHSLQLSLAKVSSFTIDNLSFFYQILICEMLIMPQRY